MPASIFPRTPGLAALLSHLLWRVVFWWKRRTGWIDLAERVEITGVVVSLEAPDLDSDRNFNVHLETGDERWITGFGGRLTTEDPNVGPSMHCEVTSWASLDLKETYDRLRVGDRVRVGGAWGFDGVHTGRAEWVEVLLALVRHTSNVRDGWFELHPVDQLKILPAEDGIPRTLETTVPSQGRKFDGG
jgi:hypothetical protein